jgi:hypothetical protein
MTTMSERRELAPVDLAPSIDGPQPQPVVCLTDHLRRDLEVARDSQGGRFTHNGLTLALGRCPDWLHAGDDADEEWRIEWVKLYEGLDLAYAYARTGDHDLLATWEDLVESFCAGVPVGHDSSDVSARRVQNWLYAWQLFAATPGYHGLRVGLAQRVVDRIHADADHIANHLTAERNHRTLELYALLVVALALDEDPDRAQAALAALADNAATDIWADGVHRECSTDYHFIVLRSLLGAIANARRAGLPVPPVLIDRTGRACDFALHVQRPDGTTPALSDGDEGDFRMLLTVAADLLARPELDWAATAGRRGTPPARRMASFPVGGYYVQRSGWGDRSRPYVDERWSVFDCGPLGDGGHGHYDQLSIELMAGGHRLVVDPGRFTYAEDKSGWRQRFKGTAAHNTVCVDGQDQTPYRGGKPKGLTSQARLVDRWTSAGLDIMRGEVRSPRYDAVHLRTVALVDDDFWVVHDRLRALSPHEYVARWHLAPAASAATSLVVDAAQATVSLPGGRLVVPSGFGSVGIEPGWVAPTYGVKLAAPVVAVTLSGQTDADLVTVIMPGDIDVRVTAACREDQIEVTVRRPAGDVHVWWLTDDSVAGREHRPW